MNTYANLGVKVHTCLFILLSYFAVIRTFWHLKLIEKILKVFISDGINCHLVLFNCILHFIMAHTFVVFMKKFSFVIHENYIYIHFSSCMTNSQHT